MSDNDLQYSEDALANRYMIYKDLQDINIFIEDVGCEYEYEAILQKLLPDIHIASIIPSGGKEGMKGFLAEFGLKDCDNPSHPNIYIVDGDFDRIVRPDEMIINDHFIYLEAYNIENYFLDEDACISFSQGRLKMPIKDTRERVKYDIWYSTIINQAKELFLIYCYLQRYYPGVQNVGNTPYIFIDQETGLERENALTDYKKELLAKYNIDVDNEMDKLEIIKHDYNKLYGEDYWYLICGKFLLTSLRNYLMSKNIKPIKENELRWWLINNINVEKFEYLVDKIHEIVQNTEL